MSPNRKSKKKEMLRICYHLALSLLQRPLVHPLSSNIFLLFSQFQPLALRECSFTQKTRWISLLPLQIFFFLIQSFFSKNPSFSPSRSNLRAQKKNEKIEREQSPFDQYRGLAFYFISFPFFVFFGMTWQLVFPIFYFCCLRCCKTRFLFKKFSNKIKLLIFICFMSVNNTYIQ